METVRNDTAAVRIATPHGAAYVRIDQIFCVMDDRDGGSKVMLEGGLEIWSSHTADEVNEAIASECQ